MKTYLAGIFALLILTFLVPDTSAQKARKDEAFPTYEQIRGNRKQIYDYVEPVQFSNGNPIGEVDKPTQTLISRHHSPFSFPADSTTYYLNGKKSKSQKVAEAELLEKAGNVERVMIGEVDKKGRRVIEIDYEPKKP
ncbi:hypothetical protein [Dyadobacter sp.]|uniref:hypothetical protein n=1 Tax=Dyadobacter sp. TaxID=1914288 RepID=UPI003F6EB9DF